MRTTTIAAALTAAAPLTSAINPHALGAKMGFALGTKNPDSSCKSTNDYEKDFDAIAGKTGSKIVRGYSASDCNFAQNILPAAQNKGFQVVLGIWPDTTESFNADNSAVQTYANQFPDSVYAVTVGSETLYRGNFTGAELNDKIKQVKSGLPSSIKIGTADSWNKYADGTADDVISSGDATILLINAFAYWQDKTIEEATGSSNVYLDDIAQAIDRVQSHSNGADIEIWNGETGWPTDGGSSYGVAKASTAWAAEYYAKSFCGILAWGINAFYFEAFDEAWKPDSTGDNGEAEDEKHWGAMDASRNQKPNFNLTCNYLDW